MNKLDLLILAGAGALAATAAGLWLSRDQVVILSPLQPSSDVGHFQRVDEKEYADEQRRIAVVVPRSSDDPLDLALLKAAKKLRNSPCSASAKAEYLAVVPAYARKNLRNNLAALRSGDNSRPELSPLAAQAGEYFNHMEMYGYITAAEHRNAMKQVTPQLGLSITASEKAGRVMDMSTGESACDRRRNGVPQPRMTWEPEDDGRDEGRPGRR